MPGAVDSRHLASSRVISRHLARRLSPLFLSRFRRRSWPPPGCHSETASARSCPRVGIRQAPGKRVSSRAPLLPPRSTNPARLACRRYTWRAKLTRSLDLGAARAKAIGSSVTCRRRVFMIPPPRRKPQLCSTFPRRVSHALISLPFFGLHVPFAVLRRALFSSLSLSLSLSHSGDSIRSAQRREIKATRLTHS